MEMLLNMKHYGHGLSEVGLVNGFHVSPMYLPSLVTGILVDPALTGSNTPTSKFSKSIVQLQRLESPVVSPPSDEAKSASLSGAWAPCDSERAASAFLKKLGGR